MRIPLYIDIETIPTTDPAAQARIAESITPPGNISKAETIAKWEAEKKPALVHEAIHKTCFDALLGRVCSIAWWTPACSGTGTMAFTLAAGQTDDAGILYAAFDQMAAEIAGLREGASHQVCLITWNGNGFDLPFLWRRATLNNIPLPWWMPAPNELRPYENHGTTRDLMVAWGGGPREYVDMASVAEAFGIPCKTGMTGADVWSTWERGETQKIAEYNKDDVDVLRALDDRMFPDCWAQAMREEAA